MGLISLILLYPVFLLARLCIHGIRDAIWWTNGTAVKITDSKKPEGYKASVHVLSIVARRKLDYIVCSHFLTDFILFHEGFEHPRYLLRSEISLYCITPREFVFIQCAEGDTAWDVRDYGFSREAQFKKAKRVLIVPVQTAHLMAEEIAEKKQEKLIFIHITGRCGSTLSCQVFQDTGKCVSYTEPGVIADLVKYATKPNDPDAQKLIRTAITMMCKPGETPLDAHVVKIQCHQGLLCPMLAEIFPDSSFLFMYRDTKAVVKSFIKLFMSLPMAFVMLTAKSFSFKLYCRLLHMHGTKSPHHPFPEIFRRTQGMYAECAQPALKAIQEYLSFRRAGLIMAGVRYEDLVADPAGAVSQMFHFCGLSEELVEPGLRGFKRDSQSNSVVSKKKMSFLELPPFSAEDERKIREMCAALELPNVLGEYLLPGTITGKRDV